MQVKSYRNLYRSNTLRYVKLVRSSVPVLMLVLVTIVVASTSILVYALTMLWQAPANVNVKLKETRALTVYLDSAATNPVTGLTFGDLEQGAQVTKVLYIKNTGNVPITLDWLSDLKSTSNNYLGDDWLFKNSQGNWQSIRGYSLPAGAVLETQYRLIIAGTAPAQSYGWALQLGY